MSKNYPELNLEKTLFIETLKNEEKKFKETLERGIKILRSKTKGLTSGQMLDGKDSFQVI